MDASRLASPFRQLRALWEKLVWRPLAWLCLQLFGRIDWQAPRWGQALGRGGRRAGATMRARPAPGRRGGAAVDRAWRAGGWYGYRWWQARPKPVEVTFKIHAPERTAIELDDVEARKPHPVVITFSASVAPLSQIGKDVTSVALSPALAGTWHWIDDRQLSFMPKDDWPAGAEYTARFQQGRLQAGSAPERTTKPHFATAPFTAKIANARVLPGPAQPGRQEGRRRPPLYVSGQSRRAGKAPRDARGRAVGRGARPGQADHPLHRQLRQAQAQRLGGVGQSADPERPRHHALHPGQGPHGGARFARPSRTI